jgi:hypothetical protein
LMEHAPGRVRERVLNTEAGAKDVAHGDTEARLHATSMRASADSHL